MKVVINLIIYPNPVDLFVCFVCVHVYITLYESCYKSNNLPESSRSFCLFCVCACVYSSESDPNPGVVLYVRFITLPVDPIV